MHLSESANDVQNQNRVFILNLLNLILSNLILKGHSYTNDTTF